MASSGWGQITALPLAPWLPAWSPGSRFCLRSFSFLPAIVNLALFFAWHLLWPAGWDGGLDGPSAVLALAAALALWRFKRSVMEVIAVCAAVGLCWQLAHNGGFVI